MATAPLNMAIKLQGVDATAGAFNSVAQKTKLAAAKISAAMKTVAGAATIAVGAVSAAAKMAQNELNALNDEAQQAGVSANWLQKFTGAMGQAGVRMQRSDIVKAVQDLNAALVNTRKLKTFEKLGVDISHLRGLAPEKALEGFLEVISKIPDEQTRLLLLQKAMSDNGMKLAPLMRLGPDAMKESLADVMAMIPAASDNTVTLATNLNNAFALVSSSLKTQWYDALGAVLTWADESFGGVDKALMRAMEYGKAWALVLVRGIQTVGEALGGIIGLFRVDWLDGLKMIGIRFAQLVEYIAGPLRDAIGTVVGWFNEDWGDAIIESTAQFQTFLAESADAIYEKHGVTPMKSWAERIDEDFKAAAVKVETWNKGLSAKANLTSMQPIVQEAFEPVKETVKDAVSDGVREGLAEGVEAGSYAVLKNAFAARSLLGANESPAAVLANAVKAVQPPEARTVSATPHASDKRFDSLPEMLDVLRKLLSTTETVHKDLAALGAF